MADDQTGPWVLALGTLAIGIGAIAAELLRRRRDADESRDGGEPRDGSGADS